MQHMPVPRDVFVGRSAEIAQLTEVITRVRAGEPWLVAIEGDPGIGKTSLVRHCLARAAGLKVLPARADPAETDLDLGIADQLLRAAGGAAPPVLAEAGTGGPVSSFAAGARLLEVVGGQQAAGAVAIVVDDLQWADRMSVEALTFTLRRLSVDPVLAVVIYRGTGDRLDETARRLLVSVENQLRISLDGLGVADVAALAAELKAESLDDEAVQWLYNHTGGHALYLRTVLSEGFDFDPRAPGRAALPASLAAAIGDHLRVLPPGTREILEVLAVINRRMPLAQLGQAAESGSSSAAIEPAVASGLVDWWPAEPTCPVEIRHPLVRDAIYSGITPTRRRALHARAALMVSESASWEHRVAALDRPDEGLAIELERLARREAAAGQLALAATHLRWASDISPGQGDGERRLLTAALYLTLVDESQSLLLRQAVEAASPSPLRGCALGTMAFAAGSSARPRRGSARHWSRRRLLRTASRSPLSSPTGWPAPTPCWGTGRRSSRSRAGRWTPVAWTGRPRARRAPWSRSARPRWSARAPPWPSWLTLIPTRRGWARSTWTPCRSGACSGCWPAI